MTAMMIVPMTMADVNMVTSNVAENDHPAWTSGTSYTTDDRVIRTATHSIYQAVAAVSGTTPPEDDPTNWVRVGSTNRWRAFDSSIGQSVTNAGSITYTIRLTEKARAVAFVGLVATSLRIVVKDSGGGVKSDETRNLVDTSGVTDWEAYYTYEPEHEAEQVFAGLPAYNGYSIELTIDAGGGQAEVGEILIGRDVLLGEIESGARSGFTDYSVRTVDAFGNINLVRRPTARRAEWPLVFPTRSNRRIQRELERSRGTVCYFHPGDGMRDFYLGVLGLADDFFPDLAAGGTTYATLSLTGVS